MKIALASMLILLNGCAHSIHQVYVSSQEPSSAGRGQWVTADSQDFIIFRFAQQSDYVEQAYRELESKCPGRIAQVTTEHLTSYKVLSYDQKLLLKGLCIK